MEAGGTVSAKKCHHCGNSSADEESLQKGSFEKDQVHLKKVSTLRGFAIAIFWLSTINMVWIFFLAVFSFCVEKLKWK